MTENERKLLLALAEYVGAHSGDPPRKARIEALGTAVQAEAGPVEDAAPSPPADAGATP